LENCSKRGCRPKDPLGLIEIPETRRIEFLVDLYDKYTAGLFKVDKKKKIMKKFILLFLTVIFSQKGICQEKYLPGYIIRIAGDTMYGNIDYQ